jgi:ABC-type sugar transport system substrate-binding protein
MRMACLILAVLALPVDGLCSNPTNRVRVVFLNPGSEEKSKEYWWSLCSDFMQAAANDLGMDLRILYANRSRTMILQQAGEVMQGPDKPDFIVMQNMKQSALPIIRMASEKGVKVFLFNSGLSEEETRDCGGPRGKYPNWIGQILPDDRGAGKLQAQVLIDAALKLGLKDKNGKVQMIATAGVMSDTSASERDKGLMEVLAARTNEVTLNRGHALPCDWERKMAEEVFSRAFGEYPETTAVWNVNDPQALGVLDAATGKFGKVPGRDILITGIDWNPPNIEKIKSGEILASVGGHFVEGVWALVLIHDYAGGIDFSSEKLSFETRMTLLDSGNVDSYMKCLQQRNREHISRIDYKQFSKKHSPKLATYNFDVDTVLKQLKVE